MFLKKVLYLVLMIYIQMRMLREKISLSEHSKYKYFLVVIVIVVPSEFHQFHLGIERRGLQIFHDFFYFVG